MVRSPDAYADALASGETERINDAIEEIKDADGEAVMAAYSELFDACYPVYESDDGYVRQSVVRFLRDAYPGLEFRIAGTEVGRVDGITLEDLAEDRTRLVEFLLEALGDDDGRVRTAAVDGLNTLGVAMNVAGLTDELEALTAELSELEESVEDEKRKHVREARQSVERYGELDSGLL